MQSLLRAIRPTPAFAGGVIGVMSIAVVAGGASLGELAKALMVVAVYVASLFVHEFSHAVTAQRAGMAVEAISISLFGGITRYSGPDPGPRVLRRIALAGPKASLLACGACLAVAIATSAAGWRGGIGSLSAWGVQANLTLGLVNLLPFGNLDGAALRAGRRV